MKIWITAYLLVFGLISGPESPAADFNGDGTGDAAVFRASSGLWAVRGITRLYFGGSTDKLVPGDYTGEVKDRPAIFRSSSGLWAVRGVTRVYFGSSTDEPVPGDLNGDRRDEMGIFRNSSGLWAFRGLSRLYFGSSTDEAIPPGRGTRRGELPVTGQTQTWKTGDDGWVEAGSAFCFQVFIKAGAQITHDRNTGLIWASDGDSRGCHFGAQTDWNTAIDWCNNLDFGSYTDWRLPNAKELQSICDYGTSYPSVDTTYFPNTRNSLYWSSSTWTNFTETAWCLQFSSGKIEQRQKPSAFYLRAVRGPQ